MLEKNLYEWSKKHKLWLQQREFSIMPEDTTSMYLDYFEQANND